MKKGSLFLLSCIIALAVGCGGGGGVSIPSSQSATENKANDQATLLGTESTKKSEERVAAEKTAGVSAQLQDLNQAARGISLTGEETLTVAVRVAAGRSANTITPTIIPIGVKIEDEVIADAGCTLNGSVSLSYQELRLYNIVGSVTSAGCNDAQLNGTLTPTGTVTLDDSDSPLEATSITIDATLLFQQADSDLELTLEVKANITKDSGLSGNVTGFELLGSPTLTAEGTNVSGADFSGVSLTLNQDDQTAAVEGTVTDADGFAMTFAEGSTLNSDGTGTLYMEITGDLTATMLLSADGSGSGSYTNNSDVEEFTVEWTADGAATLTYSADGAEETFNISL